jgi:hypothetical protein
MNGYDLRMHDNIDLHMLLDRLHRNELDVRERLARRVEALGGLGAISDPLYQRHYFAVESLKAQRVGVESELSRREGLGELRDTTVRRWLDRHIRRPAKHWVGRVFEKLARLHGEVLETVRRGFAVPGMPQRG